MCAIAGIIDLYHDMSIKEKMLASMKRRGPDGEGIYEKDNCVLLHTRLAIVDPAGGKQPMRLEFDGEAYCISYNGELYNTEEIRRELLLKGHQFHGHSDTEVVLHAYAQWGDLALDYLNGIFAFAVWEEKKRRLFLARDRIGVKPLFFSRHREGIVFASEIKTLLAYPTLNAILDADGVGELLLLGPGRTPGSGVLKGIEELEPGCCAYYERGKMHTRRYWFLRDREHTDTFSDTVEKTRWLVRDAIQRQMVSDVRIGTFLSGGLDSSLISAICAEEMAEKNEILNTFSVDYLNNAKYFQPNKFQPNSDTEYIGVMEKALGSKQNWSILSADTLYHTLEDATRARDLPGMADVDFSLCAFCKDIRSHVKVALSGECADEIFGGYPWYRDPEIRATEGFPWSQNINHRVSFLANDYLNKLKPTEFVQDRYAQTLAMTNVLPGTSPLERRMKEMVNLNFRWFMQTLLDRKDRMSMYHGLEVRVPFCDYRIAEYLYGVPWEYKNYNGIEKGLLRTAMEGILPEKVLWRKKSPYPKTFDPRYLELVTEKLNRILEDPQAPILQIIKRESLMSLIHTEYAWPWYGQLMRLPQTIAYMLQIDFWLREYKVSLA